MPDTLSPAALLGMHIMDRSSTQVLCLQDLDPNAPLDSKVDDLLSLDEASLKEMLSPGSLDEVSCCMSWWR